jgi:hypothetical protein
MSFHWTCPYCDRDTTITDSYSVSYFDLRKKNAEGTLRFTTELIVCPNPKCQRFTLKIRKHQLQITSSGPDVVADPPLESFSLGALRHLWSAFGDIRFKKRFQVWSRRTVPVTR